MKARRLAARWWTKSGDVGDLSVKRRFLEIVEAEVGDVDITKSEVLVSIGRGIEDEDNIEIARDLGPKPWGPICRAPVPSWIQNGWKKSPSGGAPPARR